MGRSRYERGETMFYGFRMFLVEEGINPARLAIFKRLIVKFHGVIVTNIDDTTSHVMATTWKCATRPTRGSLSLCIRQCVARTAMRVISYEWLCACCERNQLMDDGEYNLFISCEEVNANRKREAEIERSIEERKRSVARADVFTTLKLDELSGEVRRAVLATTSVAELAESLGDAIARRKHAYGLID